MLCSNPTLIKVPLRCMPNFIYVKLWSSLIDPHSLLGCSVWQVLVFHASLFSHKVYTDIVLKNIPRWYTERVYDYHLNLNRTNWSFVKHWHHLGLRSIHSLKVAQSWFKVLVVNYRLISASLLLRVNLDKIMHACWEFDASSARTRRVSALDCLNCQAQSNTQLLI